MANKTYRGLFLIIFFFLCIGFVQSQQTEKVRVYRVQFAASKTFIQPSYFEKKFNLEDSVQYFEKDGWYKYFVGDFDTEAEAIAYYHETGDVGYVISSIIDKPVGIEEDTTQAIVPADTIIPLDTDNVVIDSLRLDSVDIGQQLDDEDPVDQKTGLTPLQIVLIALTVILLVLLIVWLVRRKSKEEEPIELLLEDEEDSHEEPIVDKVLVAEKEAFPYLGNPGDTLSGWDQLRIHEDLKSSGENPPDFSAWLDSENLSIVTFCMRMIRTFKQTKGIEAVALLLGHARDEIRSEAIVTLGELGNTDVLELLKDRFDGETHTNKMLILRAMSRLPDKSSIDFLKNLLKNSRDFRIEASHALASIKSFGPEGVEKALKEIGEDSEIIARHILINKL